jgi:hypothetical protein
MERFEKIESLLEKVAEELNARLSRNRPQLTELLRTFEERRIDWIEKEINKAIIIQPTFEKNGDNSDHWNLKIVAWKWVNGWRIDFRQDLASKKDFEEIEQNIDTLLENAITRLGKIQEVDLKSKALDSKG